MRKDIIARQASPWSGYSMNDLHARLKYIANKLVEEGISDNMKAAYRQEAQDILGYVQSLDDENEEGETNDN